MKRILFITLLLIGLISLSGCTPASDVPKESKIKIGILTLTTGNLAFLGQNIVRSAELARSSLGYNDSVEFVVEDVGSLGNGAEAVAAYRKLVDVDKVQVIIDGMSSDSTMVVAPLLEADKVVMITPVTGGENVDNASEYLFRNGPSDVLAGMKPAKDIYEKFGYKRVALLTDNAEYTLDISKHFRDNYSGEIVIDETITPDLTDYRDVVTKVQSKDVDAIVINTATGLSAGYIIKELYEFKNTRPIFANFIAYGSNTVAIAGNESFEGVYVYDAQYDERSIRTKDFFYVYNSTYNVLPPIPFHATGTYDDVAMIMEAVNAVGYNGTRIHDYLLANIKGWDGLNGNVTFDAKGNVESGFILKQVHNGTLSLVEQ
jgi:branched-chain amino acid transport system substrate-binding protein